MKRTTFSLVSLFSGAGGLDIGLEKAGFSTTAALECDDDCAATLSANQAKRIPIPEASRRAFLHRTRLIHARIENTTTSDLMPESAPRGWSPDLLAGGPPCQPFSSAGKQRSVADPRGRLFEQFVRVAEELKPKYILFENVRGLVTARGPTGKPGEVLQLIKHRFEQAGYATTFSLLNAADYGAPQRRVRLFMIGARVSPLPCFPIATHSGAKGRSLFPEARPWLPLGNFLRSRDFGHTPGDIITPTPQLQIQLSQLREGSGLKSPGAREATRPGGHWGYKQGTFVADPSLPARTVTASSTQDWIRLSDGSHRRLTWQECAALQGFPETWTFCGDRASRYRQIGNAVPSIFGLVLGQCILEALRHESPDKPRSAPIPQELSSAIDYTLREHRRNGASREHVRAQLSKGNDHAFRLKGIGNSERHLESA